MPDPLAASIRLSTTKAALEASEFGNMPEKDEKELEIKDNDHKKSQTKREERHLVKDPNYVLKAYYDAGVQREEVPKKSSMTEDDEDNLEDSLDEDGSDTGYDKGSPKTPEAETLEQPQNTLKLEPLQNTKEDFRDYKDEKERKEVWMSVYETLTGLNMDRIRELADRQQKKINAEKNDKQWKDEL